MALVDYLSDDSSSSSSRGGAPPPAESSPPPAKRRKTVEATDQSADGSTPTLPPLPDAFHDLYAHTVRTSNVDDPVLHQGRRRLVPHVAGNWPSHLYIEWHPSQTQYESISTLLSRMRDGLGRDAALFDLLTSDLGAPLPLHISLSRPLSLITANKDDFLEDICNTIAGCGISPFQISFDLLDWHRTEESGRTFLVLRVESNPQNYTRKNKELVTILTKSNLVVKEYNQLPLYADRDEEKTASAFHISIGWTPSPITKCMVNEAATAFAKATELRDIGILVDNVKVKIGNIVTNWPLSSTTENKRNSSSLLGLF